MTSVTSNTAKNRLYLTLDGKLDQGGALTASQKAIAEARKLRAGFTIVSDISRLQPTSEEVRLIIQGAMETLQKMGMRTVARVTATSMQVSANQWQRTSRITGYNAIEVHSIEEADKILDAQ